MTLRWTLIKFQTNILVASTNPSGVLTNRIFKCRRLGTSGNHKKANHKHQ